MNADPQANFEQLPPDMAARIDAVCDRFERAWKEAGARGEPPQVTTYTAGWEESERAFLVRELLELDRACRQRYGTPGHSQAPAEIGATGETPMPSATSVDLAAPKGPVERYAPALRGLELLEVLGSGGMGVVYRARQAALGRDVAVKLLRDADLAGPGQLDRFVLEAQAVARLQHPNLVQLFEFGEVPRASGAGLQPYLVLEYISGGSLAERLRGGPLAPRQAAHLVEKLADAVHYAHGQGIIHRDLKPANILLQSSEPGSNSAVDLEFATPKITDFGLAKSLTGNDLTRTGDILGTPSYMAPELTLGKQGAVTAAVDVYGLGAILYEVLSGRPPFEGATALETLDQARTLEPAPLRRFAPSIPRDLETICLRCLEKDPRRRYLSALAVADELRRFLAGKPIAARPVSTTERLIKWARRNPKVAGLASAVLVLLVSGLTAVTVLWQQAEQARVSKAAQLGVTKKSLYDKLLLLARRAIDEYDGAGAAAFLGECAAELRDRDWRVLDQSLRSQCAFFPGDFMTAAFSRDGRLLAVSNVEGVRVLDVDRAKEITHWSRKATSPQIVFTADKRLMEVRQFSISTATGSGTGVLAFPITQKVRWQMHAAELSGAPFEERFTTGMTSRPSFLTATAKYFVSLPQDEPIQVLDGASGAPSVALEKNRVDVRTAAVDPDETTLAAACKDGKVRFWDLTTGKQSHELPQQDAPDLRISMSGRGRQLAVYALNRNTRFRQITCLDVATGTEMYTVGFVPSVFPDMRFSPNGRFLAFALEKSIQVIDAHDGARLFKLLGHDSMVHALWISADGTRLASLAGDGARVWDLRGVNKEFE